MQSMSMQIPSSKSQVTVDWESLEGFAKQTASGSFWKSVQRFLNGARVKGVEAHNANGTRMQILQTAKVKV